MKANKTQVLMYILYLLFEYKKIKKEQILDVVELTDLTFSRYMQEIKAFFINFNYPYELKYSRSDNIYYLKQI